jgi:hypothetical protein
MHHIAHQFPETVKTTKHLTFPIVALVGLRAQESIGDFFPAQTEGGKLLAPVSPYLQGLLGNDQEFFVFVANCCALDRT